MMKMLRKKRKGGFTLIELIVVIAIIGILAAIAIPRLGGFRDGAQTATNEATLRTIQGAANMYVANFGATAVGTGNRDLVAAGYLDPLDTDSIYTGVVTFTNGAFTTAVLR